jgi:UDP-3-O-[3-hydroxymyristoyl] glucosamine N-acyltransferase
MQRTVKQLALELGGTVIGVADYRVQELRALDETHSAAISPFFRKRLLDQGNSLPGAVLATRPLAYFALGKGVQAAVSHPSPAWALAQLIELFYPAEENLMGIHETAVVHSAADIHPTAYIGPYAVIERDVKVEGDSCIGAHAVICEGTVIGKKVRIGPGAIIGAPGFGFIPTDAGPAKMRHVGHVVIEDEVEIGANTCIDRATLGTTTIGRATKLDNLVQVGHNTKIGKNALIAGQTGLAGSTIIGDSAMLGGQVGVADHLTIGARARIAAKSGVVGDVKEGETFAGYPAVPHRKWLRAMAILARQVEHDTKLKR